MLSAQFVKILRELNAEGTLTSLQVLIQKSHLMEVETCRVRSLTSPSVCVEKPLRCVWELQDALRLSWLLHAISLSSSTTSAPSVPGSKPRAKTNQLRSQPMLKKPFMLYLPIDVLLQADGAVRGGAATECVQRSAAAFPVSFTFGFKLPGLHFFQCLHCKPVHGILQKKEEKWKRQRCCVRDCNLVGEKHHCIKLMYLTKLCQAQTNVRFHKLSREKDN